MYFLYRGADGCKKGNSNYAGIPKTGAKNHEPDPLGIIFYMQISTPDFLSVLYGNLPGICIMTFCLGLYLLPIIGEKGWWILKFKFPENRKKEFLLSLVIILSGNVLGAGMFLWETKNSHVYSLPRKEYGQGSYEETLKASTSEGTAEIQITVEEQQYSQSQIDQNLKAASEFLTQWFKSKASSKNIINKDLDLPSQIRTIPLSFSGVPVPPKFFPGKASLEKIFLQREHQ